jgi:hypothetical protein
MSVFWEFKVSVILSKKVYIYMCQTPNVFQDAAVSLYSCKTPYVPEFCAQETVDDILQHQQWHYHRRSCSPTAYQHIRQLWRSAEFCTALLQCHYQWLKQPTDTSHRFTCLIQWRNMAGVKENFGRQIQTPVEWKSSVSETVRYRTRVHIHFFFFRMTSQNIDISS